MTFYIAITFASFLLSLLGTRLLILTSRRRVVPIDPSRPLHDQQKPIPRSGGVAIVMALIICMMVADVNYGVVLALFLLTAISLLDDLISISGIVKLLVQILAVLIALAALNTPVFGDFFSPGVDRAVATFLWIWIIHLFKSMDGIDGITPTEMISISIGFCVITIITETFPTPLATYSLIMLAAGWGFLWWNRHPARILLGEVGSVPIGFVVGYLLILAIMSGYIYAAAILPAYYVSDGTISMLRRAFKGKKFWGKHSEYYYQQAVRKGRKHDTVVRYIFGVNLLLILLATFSVLSPDLGGFHVAMAYMAVFLILGFFAYEVHDPHYEPF